MTGIAMRATILALSFLHLFSTVLQHGNSSSGKGIIRNCCSRTLFFWQDLCTGGTHIRLPTYLLASFATKNLHGENAQTVFTLSSVPPCVSFWASQANDDLCVCTKGKTDFRSRILSASLRRSIKG